MSDSSPYRIEPATPSQRAEALLLLLQDMPPAQRTQQAAALLREARVGSICLEHLLVATRGAQIEGVVWANALEGNLAALWPPQFRQDSSLHDELAQSLVEAAQQRVEQASEVALWQASLDIDSIVAQQRLEAVGYQPLAVLAQLLAVPSTARSLASTEPLEFVRYASSDFTRLCNLLEATYLDTLDCPELDALRSTADSVTGYADIGHSSEEYWYFVQHAARDCGCLLLAEHEEQQFELVYMGLTQQCRGKGWGSLLVAHSLRVARECGSQAMTTSVDERNTPALRVYQQAGFSTWGRRQIMFKPARFQR